MVLVVKIIAACTDPQILNVYLSGFDKMLQTAEPLLMFPAVSVYEEALILLDQ